MLVHSLHIGIVRFSRMAKCAIMFPYWDGEEYVISNDEKIGDAEPVAYGQGCGVGEIAAWLDGGFGFLGVGSEQHVRKVFESTGPNAEVDGCVHYGEGHAVLRIGDLFLVISRWSRRNSALLSKAQILSVLDLYSSFRSVNLRRKERPPVPFEFEYDAEGEEAVRRFEIAGGDVSMLDDDF